MSTRIDNSKPYDHDSRQIADPEGSRRMPITRDDAYVHKLLSENVWRKAIHVDGEFKWVDESGSLGEPVSMDRTWKMRSFGQYVLLAPKDEAEGQNTLEDLENFDAEAVMADESL